MFQEPGFKMGLMPAEMRVSAFFLFLGVAPDLGSFISSDSRRKGTKEDCYPKAPSKGMQTQSRRNRRLFVCFCIAGRRDILFIGWRVA